MPTVPIRLTLQSVKFKAFSPFSTNGNGSLFILMDDDISVRHKSQSTSTTLQNWEIWTKFDHVFVGTELLWCYMLFFMMTALIIAEVQPSEYCHFTLWTRISVCALHLSSQSAKLYSCAMPYFCLNLYLFSSRVKNTHKLCLQKWFLLIIAEIQHGKVKRNFIQYKWIYRWSS